MARTSFSALQVAMVTILVTGSLWTERATAALLTDPRQLHNGAQYDFIVIGGGAGGGVIANRLTEEPQTKVLLIEAGSSDFDDINIEVPGFVGNLHNTRFDWNFTTTNQTGLNGRSIAFERGHVLGGSTCVNFMTYSRGSRDDYDRWANVTDDEGWSWDMLFPLMQKMEKLTPPTDGHNTTGNINPAIHGFNGPIETSLTGTLFPADKRVFNTTALLPDEFPFNEDYNSGNTIGIGWTQSTIGNGQRSNSATGYIAPALDRSNLDVLVNTQVIKLLKTGEEDGVPIVKGVQFTQSAAGPVFTLSATREVIVSAGAVKTPQLLMLSGIGDSSELSSLGIPTLVDSPDVGKNVQDHPFVANLFTVSSNDTLDNLTSDAAFFAAQEALWLNDDHRGELGDPNTNEIGWLRLPQNASIWENAADPSAGPASAHYEFLISNGFVPTISPAPGGHFITILTAVVSPASRGTITLASSDPFAAPVIDPGYLTAPFDVFIMREAIKSARRFFAAPSWDEYILAEFGAFAQAITDEGIEAYARQNAQTINHVCCTAAMGRNGTSGAGEGALNPDLTVKGVRGVRVVDASAFPFIPAAHTQTATYVLAERAATLIKLAPDGFLS